MTKSKKHIDEKLLRESREWKAFALRRAQSGGWDAVEMDLPNRVVDQFKTVEKKSDILGNIIARMRLSISRHAQR